MFGGAANVLPYQRLGGEAPQTPLTKATPTLWHLQLHTTILTYL